MRNFLLFLFIVFFISSCSNKKQLIYISDVRNNILAKVKNLDSNKIEFGDVLKIDIHSDIPEAAVPYNNFVNTASINNIDQLIIDGYFVDNNLNISLPLLGTIDVSNLSENELSKKIEQLLVENGHLTSPYVKVKKINSKFTVLGEVNSPGTFPFYDNKLNIFQALGYAGDLQITAKRNNITLIREENGLRKTYKVSLTKSELLEKPFYYIKNNDVLIVDPNFSKVKSAGFIGSPASIASISSILLSITLLLINNNN